MPARKKRAVSKELKLGWGELTKRKPCDSVRLPKRSDKVDSQILVAKINEETWSLTSVIKFTTVIKKWQYDSDHYNDKDNNDQYDNNNSSSCPLTTTSSIKKPCAPSLISVLGQTSYDSTYMWNLKKMIQITETVFTKQKQTHRHRLKRVVTKGERCWGRDKLGVWD